jgi:F-type H+-transporting ATPase subunit delta
MVNVSIARRYARALLEACEETEAVAAADQLASLTGLIAANPDLADALGNPAYSRAQRHGVIEGLIQLLPSPGPVLPNFLRLLVDRKRLSALPDIARLFRDMTDARAGRVRGEVVSAVPLDPEAVERLQKSLSQILNKQVVLETRVDRDVLGGISTRVGSVVFDGTVRTQLDELHRALRS